jgi:hypothetical protein
MVLLLLLLLMLMMRACRYQQLRPAVQQPCTPPMTAAYSETQLMSKFVVL